MDDGVRWAYALYSYNRGPKYVGKAYIRDDGIISEYVVKLPPRLRDHGTYASRVFAMRNAIRAHEGY